MALLDPGQGRSATRYLPIVIATADEPAAVAAHALALGADDVLALPIEDAELQARTRALARLAAMEIERRRRDALLAHFGVAPPPESPGRARDRPHRHSADRPGGRRSDPGPDRAGRRRHRGLRRDRGFRDRAPAPRQPRCRPDHDQPRPSRAAAPVRRDPQRRRAVRPAGAAGRAPQHFADRAQPFAWGVSDVLFQPFHPEVLRLRVQAWVRQQRLRRHLRGGLGSLPPTTDRLTRLYGHGFLHAYVEPSDRRERCAGGTLAVASVAVAQMGQINQLYGYAAGDRVLATLGGVLARSSRAEDLPARLDGDRFCLVIDNATALEARAAPSASAFCAGRALHPDRARDRGRRAGRGRRRRRLIGRAFAHKQLFTRPAPRDPRRSRHRHSLIGRAIAPAWPADLACAEKVLAPARPRGGRAPPLRPLRPCTGRRWPRASSR